MKPRSHRLVRHQRGQSLIEMAIALIVLVPLAVGVTLLGQYMHIKQQTQAAARQAAWAATVDPALARQGLPNRSTTERKLRAWQFADAHDKLTSAGAAPTHFGDSLLTTFAGQELLKPQALSLNVYKQESSPGYLDKAMAIVGKAAKTLGNLPPNTKGLVTAEAHARPEKITGSNGSPLAFLDPLDTMQLDFSAHTVLLADTWDAAGAGENLEGKDTGGDRTVRHIIRPLVPTTWLGSSFDDVTNKVINILGKIPIVNDIFTPGFDKFELGRTAPDVVPADKLAPYKNGR